MSNLSVVDLLGFVVGGLTWDPLDRATAEGWSWLGACRELELGEVRAHRWAARRSDGELEDRRPGGSPMHCLLEEEGHCCVRSGASEPQWRDDNPSPALASAFAGFRSPPGRHPARRAVVPALRPVVPRRGGAACRAGIRRRPRHVYRWAQRFTPLLADAARPCRHAVGDRWHVDETYLKVSGSWYYLYRAVDQFGQVVDVLLSSKRDGRAARRFFAAKAIAIPGPSQRRSWPTAPRRTRRP